jgi:hypothetical protein
MKLIKAPYWGKEMTLIANAQDGKYVIHGYVESDVTIWLADEHSDQGYIGYDNTITEDEVLEGLGDF